MIPNGMLSKINNPADLKPLNQKQLEQLCVEIRREIMEVVSKNGGHLASNLGTVELTCCLEKVFCDKEDSIIFDVGHQCYTHKLLTGRKECFDTLRKENGISGFLRPSESEYDAFVSGHSSTALSSALGLSAAKHMRGENGQVVAVIGDGAATGGLFYEALNNAAQSENKVVIVINDNEMSISKNIGGISKHLAKLTSRRSYFDFKDFVEKFLKGIPLIGKGLFRAAVHQRDFLKRIFAHSTIFADMGVKYIGPVDGHDIGQLLAVFERAKKRDVSVVVHCITVKGKGFTEAENNPTQFHSTAPFIIENGAAVKPPDIDFSGAFGEVMCRLAESDERICAVTASMCDGTGLSVFSKRFPNRFFDVGIAEQHAVTFCAGLAKGGMIPVLAVYSTFLQRGYDQLIHDVAIAGLHVIFCIDRAGFVGADGETHHGLFDVAYFNSIPGFTVFSPANFEELNQCLERAVNLSGPVAIRYPKGIQKLVQVVGNESHKNNILAVGYGRVGVNVLNASHGIAEAVKLLQIKPIEDKIIKNSLGYKKIVFFEEAVHSGSVGEEFLFQLQKQGFRGEFEQICIPDEFVAQASVSSQLKQYGLDEDSIRQRLLNLIKNGDGK
ncbi:MAG TPA: 1-deoxy-D-xylulose-5-phosphate synthase [Clostridiales bacterium]|nr:1-deoxy-D-xylulose-5-phosphate synthase [Clostridiales bacterium]